MTSIYIVVKEEWEAHESTVYTNIKAFYCPQQAKSLSDELNRTEGDDSHWGFGVDFTIEKIELV